jgi:acyl carrier protein
MQSIINQLIPIFRNVFDDDSLVISGNTTAHDVDGWDSLAHIRLIVAIEKHYQLSFTVSEISNISNVGEMAILLSRKIKDA